MKSPPQEIYIGCSGFYNADWKGTLYPEDAENKDFLKLYSGVYSTVEINSTFYRKPTAKTLQKWNNETPDDFRFFIKVPKTISHSGYSENKREALETFCRHIKDHLERKLAGFLIQFPASFHCTEDNMRWLTETLPDDVVLAVEFRHASWWNDEIFDLFQKHQWIFCGVSFSSRLSENIIVTHPNIGYYRLHGRPVLYKSLYSTEFLDQLSKEIRTTGKDFYVMFNNTWGTAAVDNSLYLKKILKS